MHAPVLTSNLHHMASSMNIGYMETVSWLSALCTSRRAPQLVARHHHLDAQAITQFHTKRNVKTNPLNTFTNTMAFVLFGIRHLHLRDHPSPSLLPASILKPELTFVPNRHQNKPTLGSCRHSCVSGFCKLVHFRRLQFWVHPSSLIPSSIKVRNFDSHSQPHFHIKPTLKQVHSTLLHCCRHNRIIGFCDSTCVIFGSSILLIVTILEFRAKPHLHANQTSK